MDCFLQTNWQRRWSLTLTVLLGSLLSVGCVSDQYRYGVANLQATPFPTVSNRMAVGGDHPFVDRVESVVQSPRRLVRRIAGRRIRTDVENRILRRQAASLSQSYLSANSLSDVYIDVRRYEPGEQWDRIRKNDRMAPLWKYTGGALAWLNYTLIPRRALQSDRYDVFANTLSINSSRPTSALYQAARAKEFRQHKYLGTYAILQRAPLVPLYHHTRTSSDVLSYARATGQSEDMLEQLYPTTYSRLAAATVSEALFFSPLPDDTPFVVEPVTRIIGRAVGGTIGRIALRNELSNRRIAPADYEASDNHGVHQFAN